MLTWIMVLAISASQVQVVSSDTVFASGRPHRLYRVDAPQMDGQCAVERARAATLEQVVNELVASANSVDVRPGFDPRGHKSWPTDRHGVRLARISLDGRDLGEILISAGYATH